MRIGFDLSILSFNAAGNARYAQCLFERLRAVEQTDLQIIPLDIPLSLRAVAPGLSRKALVAFWELVYAPLWLPLLVRRQRLDLLHCPAPIPVGGTVCPLLVTIHDIIPLLYPQLFSRVMRMRLQRWIRRSVQVATALLTDAQQTVSDLRQVFPKLTAPIYPIALGSFLATTHHKVYAQARKHILTVGTLEPRKNLRGTLEAYAHLLQMYPNAPPLVVVGGQGWGGEHAPSVAHQLGIAARVVFTGYITDDRLRELYAQAVMLVYPSFYEGFGFPVLEAMSMGCPVITAKCSSLPEVAGRAALLVAPDDHQAIAAAMRQILAEPHVAARLQAEGLRRARLFSWERCADETQRVYQQVLGLPTMV